MSPPPTVSPAALVSRPRGGLDQLRRPPALRRSSRSGARPSAVATSMALPSETDVHPLDAGDPAHDVPAPDTRFGSGRATVTQSGQEPEQAMRSGTARGRGDAKRSNTESAGNRQGDRRPRPAWRRHGVPEHEHR